MKKKTKKHPREVWCLEAPKNEKCFISPSNLIVGVCYTTKALAKQNPWNAKVIKFVECCE